MPEISRFYGIRVRMQYGDHAPPHFHASYGGFSVTVRISDGLVEGRFPRRALRLLLAWYDRHRDELDANWRRAARGLPLARIAPLE